MNPDIIVKYVFVPLIIFFFFIMVLIKNLPYLRMVLLKTWLKTLRKNTNRCIYIREQSKKILVIIEKNTKINSVLIEEFQNMEFAKSDFLKNTLNSLYEFQDKLERNKRQSDFKLKSWWPEKYLKELEGLRKETKELIQKIRQED